MDGMIIFKTINVSNVPITVKPVKIIKRNVPPVIFQPVEETTLPTVPVI